MEQTLHYQHRIDVCFCKRLFRVHELFIVTAFDEETRGLDRLYISIVVPIISNDDISIIGSTAPLQSYVARCDVSMILCTHSAVTDDSIKRISKIAYHYNIVIEVSSHSIRVPSNSITSVSSLVITIIHTSIKDFLKDGIVSEKQVQNAIIYIS